MHAYTASIHLLRLTCAGATLSLKLKTEAFDLRTRDSSAGRLVGSAAGLLARALPALERELRAERGVKLRLLGVRVSRLQREGAKWVTTDTDSLAFPTNALYCYHRPFTATKRHSNVDARPVFGHKIADGEDTGYCSARGSICGRVADTRQALESHHS